MTTASPLSSGPQFPLPQAVRQAPACPVPPPITRGLVTLFLCNNARSDQGSLCLHLPSLITEKGNTFPGSVIYLHFFWGERLTLSLALKLLSPLHFYSFPHAFSTPKLSRGAGNKSPSNSEIFVPIFNIFIFYFFHSFLIDSSYYFVVRKYKYVCVYKTKFPS